MAFAVILVAVAAAVTIVVDGTAVMTTTVNVNLVAAIAVNMDTCGCCCRHRIVCYHEHKLIHMTIAVSAVRPARVPRIPTLLPSPSFPTFLPLL